MDTSHLEKFARSARRQLIDQVSARLDWVLNTDSVELRERKAAVNALKKQIEASSRGEVTERIAYIWFNRFCALRFMDANNYTEEGVVSPEPGFTQPEMLRNAKGGHIEDRLVPFIDSKRVLGLLNGQVPSSDPQGEAYRMLLVAVCNYYNSIMPFMFEQIDDYTELLIPEDLLSGDSILHAVRETLTADRCGDVEVIGWLYQFYISERKEQVYRKLKKQKKVQPEEIPAVTQLFTPHWIVRYLTENSLGRLWMLNRPDSALKKRMDYYIEHQEKQDDFLRINTPEEIKVCDPACGSGHMLVYAFDLLYAVYEGEGYQASEIPSLILQNNLFGIEIDQRAAALAAFALVMKAREKDRRFFSDPTQPNICVLENISFEHGELEKYMDRIGRDLFTADLETTLNQFQEADNFGSLIRPEVKDLGYIRQTLEEKGMYSDIFLHETHRKVLKALEQADYLGRKYHVVIANPPYMGSKNMNGRLKEFSRKNYKKSKSDLFAMFIERNLELAGENGFVSMITMQSWMFLSSFENLRNKILDSSTIFSMAHLGPNAFDSIGGHVVSTTSFVIENSIKPQYEGSYLRLVDGKNEEEKESELIKKREEPFRASASDFKKIPGSPIAYWASERVREIFVIGDLLSPVAKPCVGLQSGDNNLFRRNWQEISFHKIGFFGFEESLKWFPYNSGGKYRKWYGNHYYVVDWENDGERIKNFKDSSGNIRSRPQNTHFYFRESISWSKVTSGGLAMRYFPEGFIFDVAGCSIFGKNNKIIHLLGFFNGVIKDPLISSLSPTLNYEVGQIAKTPIIALDRITLNDIDKIVRENIKIAKSDWDAYERSWDFETLPLLSPEFRHPTLKETYSELREHWQGMTDRMKELEEENNRIFIDAYGLEEELTPDVPLKEITLTCNPHYRYKGDRSEEELEALLLSDTMKELISYAVGCMFGRYSLDKPGLILANQGETIGDYLEKVPEPSFMADDDNVIPVLDRGWFNDDITERFYRFLKVAFGEEKFEENLQFIENSLEPREGKKLTVRKYFLTKFYKDHVRRYKKRPIYWLFSSPKKSFQALIYMHRYRPDTVSVVLNGYLRDYRAKLRSRKDHLEHVRLSSEDKREKTKALKEIEKIRKIINELEKYEREVLYPLATKNIDIDLDDGVKVNYPEFGKALRKVMGLS